MGLSLKRKLSALVQRRLQMERRGGKRVVPVQRTVCLLRTPGEDGWVASAVQDLSFNGVGVAAERGYELGQVLHALLVNASHTFSVTVELKVVRCYRFTEKQFFLAGAFARPLAHEEIVPFII